MPKKATTELTDAAVLCHTHCSQRPEQLVRTPISAATALGSKNKMDPSLPVLAADSSMHTRNKRESNDARREGEEKVG